MNGAAGMLSARTHVTCQNRRGARNGCSKMPLPQGRELGLIAVASEPLWALQNRARIHAADVQCISTLLFGMGIPNIATKEAIHYLSNQSAN